MKLYVTLSAFVSMTVAASAAVFVTNTPDKDAFARALAPTLNYGGGGSLSVSGANPTTGNSTNGAFDTFLSFNTLAMVTNFNNVFGARNWVITSATLNLAENQTPGNPVFNSGFGRFQIRWIANDTWTEGAGTPSAPGGAGITYAQEPAYLDSATDTNLGVCDYTGSIIETCPLALPPAFVNNMQAGGEVGLYLTAIDPQLGFVFYSRQYAGVASTHPALVVSAVPQPIISGITVTGANVALIATNGAPGGTYCVLASPTLTTPFNQWTPIATNVPSSSGPFSITLTNAVTAIAQFYILQTQ